MSGIEYTGEIAEISVFEPDEFVHGPIGEGDRYVLCQLVGYEKGIDLGSRKLLISAPVRESRTIAAQLAWDWINKEWTPDGWDEPARVDYVEGFLTYVAAELVSGTAYISNRPGQRTVGDFHVRWNPDAPTPRHVIEEIPPRQT